MSRSGFDKTNEPHGLAQLGGVSGENETNKLYMSKREKLARLHSQIYSASRSTINYYDQVTHLCSVIRLLSIKTRYEEECKLIILEVDPKYFASDE